MEIKLRKRSHHKYAIKPIEKAYLTPTQIASYYDDLKALAKASLIGVDRLTEHQLALLKFLRLHIDES